MPAAMKLFWASHTIAEMSLCAELVGRVSFRLAGSRRGNRNRTDNEREKCYIRLSTSKPFALVLLSQNLINPSLPAVATALLAASLARSRHVTFSLTFWITLLSCVVGSRKRRESSEDMMASWSTREYVSGSCRAAVDMILYM